MKLLEIKIKNFMPYRGEQVVKFPQNESQNVMLIFGENMRGKTSFLNAIRWGFYGVAVGRHLRPIPRVSLINVDAVEDGECSMSVILKFEHAKKKYELRRQIDRKAHVSVPRGDSDFLETSLLRVDDEVLPGDQVVNQINQLIPEEISRFFLFDGELLQEYENLLIEESEQGEKIKEHIEQALGVPALIHGRDELRMLLKSAQKTQAKDAQKNKELAQYAEQQKELDSRLSSLEEDKARLQVQQAEKQKEVDEIDDELKNTAAVQRKKGELDRLADKKAMIEEQIANEKETQRELLTTLWRDILYKSTQPKLENLRVERDKLQNSITERAQLETIIRELESALKETLCPTCSQIVPDENSQKIEERLSELKARLSSKSVDLGLLSQITGKIDQLSKVTSQSESKRFISAKINEEKLDIQLIELETKLDELADEIREFDTKQIMRQREKREHLLKLLNRIESDLTKVKQEIEENQRKQDQIANIISRSAGAQGQLSSRRVNIYQQLEQTFSAGIVRLRDKLKEEVQQRSSDAFSELTTENTYSGLKINSNYGLSILDHMGRQLKERSAGAEQIVALALIDGLNKTARTSGPIVMDTPLGRLDPRHRKNVLKYLPKMAEQVVLLVHEGEIDPKGDLSHFAEKIGARYEIKRISSTESRIVKGD